jgi:hypothetical protein
MEALGIVLGVLTAPLLVLATIAAAVLAVVTVAGVVVAAGAATDPEFSASTSLEKNED